MPAAPGTWKLFMECLLNWAKEFQGLVHIYYIFGFSPCFYIGHIGEQDQVLFQTVSNEKRDCRNWYKELSLTSKDRKWVMLGHKGTERSPLCVLSGYRISCLLLFLHVSNSILFLADWTSLQNSYFSLFHNLGLPMAPALLYIALAPLLMSRDFSIQAYL